MLLQNANTTMEMLEHVLLRSPAATKIAGALCDFIYNGMLVMHGGIEKQKLLLLMYIYNAIPCLFLRSSWQNSRGLVADWINRSIEKGMN